MGHKETSVLLVLVIIFILGITFYLYNIREQMKEIDTNILTKLQRHDELINLYL
jgi:hypothetical protein